MLEREEAGKPGAYFLAGVNPETGTERFYISDAEVIRPRIKRYLARDFWKSGAFLVSPKPISNTTSSRTQAAQRPWCTVDPETGGLLGKMARDALSKSLNKRKSNQTVQRTRLRFVADLR